MKVSKRPGPRRSPARLFAPRTFSSNQHLTLKKNPLRRHHLDEFVRLYNPESRHEREPTFSEENPEGRWRRYSYEEIMRCEGVNLDLSWIRDKSLFGDTEGPKAMRLVDTKPVGPDGVLVLTYEPARGEGVVD